MPFRCACGSAAIHVVDLVPREHVTQVLDDHSLVVYFLRRSVLKPEAGRDPKLCCKACGAILQLPDGWDMQPLSAFPPTPKR